MRKTFRLFLLLVSITLASTIGSKFAQADPGEEHLQTQSQCHCHHRKHHHHCRHHHNTRHHHHFAKLAAKLGLSDQQKNQMKEVFKKNQPLVKPILTKLIHEKGEMRTLIHSGSADEAAIRAQAAKIASVEADLAVQRAQIFKQFRTVLTPGQIEKFKAIQKEKDTKFDKFREQMHEL